jgi:hypothetical protein
LDVSSCPPKVQVSHGSDGIQVFKKASGTRKFSEQLNKKHGIDGHTKVGLEGIRVSIKKDRIFRQQ